MCPLSECPLSEVPLYCDNNMHGFIDFLGCLVFGFSQSTFRAVEQGESYTIGIGFLSGAIPDFILGRVELTLEGTTSEFTLFRLASIAQ